MSVRIMGSVWELDLPAPEKLVLLAMADHADHEGGNVRPSIDLIAWKTGYSPRQTQRIVKLLVDRGLLLPVSNIDGGRGQATHYRIELDGSPRSDPRPPRHLTPFQRLQTLSAWIEQHGPVCYICGGVGDDTHDKDGNSWHVDRVIPGSKGGRYEGGNMAVCCAMCNRKKGATLAPFINPKGAIHDTERVPSTTPKGAICDIERVPSDARKGAIAMSPEPIEPSIEPSVEPNPLPPYRSKGLVRRNTYPPEFEEFWSEYPVGNGIKKKAAEQWSKLDPDVDLFLEIMAGLARWKACDRWQEGYVKYAETWLKDRWWENMPPPSKPRSMNGSSPAERTAANFDRVLQRMKQQQSGPDVIDIHGEVRS